MMRCERLIFSFSSTFKLNFCKGIKIMRKYFLLSAVALLATSTANATTDYAEVTARATIEVAGTFDCPEIDFGTIVVKQNNSEITIYDSDTDPNHSSYDDFISMSKDPTGLQCTYNSNKVDMIGVYIDLQGTKGGAPLNLTYNTGYQLVIPDNVTPDVYTGTTTILAIDGELQY